MASIMTKRGTQDNIATYEFFCDTHEDLENISTAYMTLGTVAIVLHDTGDKLGAYISDSEKNWVSLFGSSDDNED